VKLAGLARVKNEADIIEPFVRHHTRLLDWLTVVDNGSSDGTSRILDALVGEGLPLNVVRDENFEYFQSKIMTYFARASLLALACDRLFLLDADEFLRVASRSELDECLKAIPYECHGLIPWETYVPTPQDARGEANPVCRIRHKRKPNSDTKVVLSRRFVDQSEASVAPGNHFVSSPEPDCLNRPLPNVTLGHFPVRSVAQLQTKALAWNGYIAAGMDDAGLGFQWKAIHDRLLSNRHWSDADFYEIARVYAAREEAPDECDLVEDPFPAMCDNLRYPDLVVIDPFSTALVELRRMAAQHAAARRGRHQGRIQHGAHDAIDVLLTKPG
jgi:hypothetical protein